MRSMASRGHLGGLSDAAVDAADILDAMGKDIVVTETVGVGQAEVEVALVERAFSYLSEVAAMLRERYRLDR